jgi:hypothetical protein
MMIMIQHVIAQEPTAVELEAACRKLIDEGKPFCPETPEVIKALKAEQKAWKPRKQAICNGKRLIEEIREEIPKAKARAKAMAEKAKAEAEKRKAEEEARVARLTAEAMERFARLDAENEMRKQAEEENAAYDFCRELEQKTEQQIKKAYEWGCKVALRSPSEPVKNKMFWSNLVYGKYLDRELRELGVGVIEQCLVAFALAVFEGRRKLRIWESAIAAESPTLPSPRRSSSKHRRRVEAKPAKLAAARTEQITGEQTNGTALAACARPAAKRTQKPKGGQS